MKRAFICAPLRNNVNQNIINAVRFGEYALKECDTTPVVPHFFGLMLDDSNNKERELGCRADMSLLWLVDEVWVFGEEITEGMREEIKRAKMLQIPIKYHSDSKVQKILTKYGGNKFDSVSKK